jgi:hypothetical protein
LGIEARPDRGILELPQELMVIVFWNCPRADGNSIFELQQEQTKRYFGNAPRTE